MAHIDFVEQFSYFYFEIGDGVRHKPPLGLMTPSHAFGIEGGHWREPTRAILRHSWVPSEQYDAAANAGECVRLPAAYFH